MTAVFVNNDHTTSQCVYMEVWETGGHGSLTRDRRGFSINHLVSSLNDDSSMMFCSEMTWKSAWETKLKTDIGQYVDGWVPSFVSSLILSRSDPSGNLNLANWKNAMLLYFGKTGPNMTDNKHFWPHDMTEICGCLSMIACIITTQPVLSYIYSNRECQWHLIGILHYFPRLQSS